MPDALLDEVTALVEWPVVYAGTFDAAFLAVPQECLILTMQLNQRYFALADDAGKLVNRFLLVSNLATRDPSAIVAGNERVLRARLADAKFFFDQDRKQRLDARLPKLASVVYHNKLGTQARARRARCACSRRASRRCSAPTPRLADRAALLAKADLVTDMVGEFPELQGLMGRYYATHDGERRRVAAAIEQHYWPKAAGGALPRSRRSRRPWRSPTSSKRWRACSASARCRPATRIRSACAAPRSASCASSSSASTPCSLSRARRARVRGVRRGAGGRDRTAGAVLDFIYDRLRGYLRDQGYSANQVAAVLDARPDVDRRPAVAARRRAGVRGAARSRGALRRQQAHRQHPAQERRRSGARGRPRAPRRRRRARPVSRRSQRLAPQVEDDFGNGDFTGALRALATAKPAVDRYFDDVMVMADDPAIRANRLALLRGVAHTMNRVADISQAGAMSDGAAPRP